jgi:hypothetical protein
VSRLRRFLHIERSRADRPEAAGAAHPGAAAARFGTFERPSGAPAGPAATGGGLGRFEAEPPASLEIARVGPGERPFTRCMRCGMDHHRLATECEGCGERLDTGPQREFNEGLWAARRQEAARDARAAEERRALAPAEAADASRERGAMEELAREVGRRERLRLDTELGGGGWDAARRLFLALLRRLDR